LPASRFAEFSANNMPELTFNSGVDLQAVSIGR
jgi:hypothetical protein